MKRPKWIDKRLMLFLMFGTINTLAGAIIMFALYNFFHVSYWIASAVIYIAGGILSFFLNKYITFKKDGKSKESTPRQVFRFALTVALSYLLSYGLAQPLMGILLSSFSKTVRDNVAMIVGLGLYTVLNYFGQRYFAFRVGDKT